MKKIVKAPSVNLLDAYQGFTAETGKKKIRLGEFLWWLCQREDFRKNYQKGAIK